MLISELQAQLETIKQEHGDVSVVIREFAGLPNFWNIQELRVIAPMDEDCLFISIDGGKNANQ